MKNILITGNLGYIGPVLTSHLLKKDYIISGLDTGWFEFCNVKNIISDKPSLQIYKDIRDISESDLNDFDAVVHLCAVSNDPMGHEFEDATYSINLEASINLAKMCSKMNVSNFVFASSCSVYGAGGDKPKTELDSVNPLTAYAKSKIAFEEALEDISSDSEMCITALRFSTACGPSPRIRLDLVLNDFVATALTKNSIEILSDGSPLRPLIDVEDMSRAIEWSIDRNPKNGGKFLVVNVGRNDNNLTVLQMAELVKELIPNVNLSVNTNAAPDKRSYAVDFSLYESLCGDYRAQWTIKDSALRLIELMEPIKEKLNNFRDSHLIRHNVLRDLKDQKVLDENLRLNK